MFYFNITVLKVSYDHNLVNLGTAIGSPKM
jgi:hypothetical protein